MVDHKVYYDVFTPVNFIVRSAAVYGDKDAVVYKDRRYSYQEFFGRINCLASALLKIGIGKGDKVAFICPNTPPILEAHFAVPMIGSALVSINIRLSSQEILHIINHSDAKVLFVDNEFSEVVKPILNELTAVKTLINICDLSDEKPLNGMEYEEFLNTGSDNPVEISIEDEYEVASINYTSGTTGFPKGVMYHHRGAYLNALGEVMETGLNFRSVYLWTLPMFHCNGWCFPWAVTAVGGTHVCLRRVVAEEIFRLVETENVSHLCAAPTVLIGMSTYAEKNHVRLTSTLEVITAGAPPSPTIIQNMEAIGTNITHVYGLTEVYGPHSICAWQPKWDKLPVEEKAMKKSRQGVPHTIAMYMEVVDPKSMTPVPRDGKTMGEILMRGNNVMLGYYKDPDATAKAFEGGWFHSGDLAVVHPDGYVQIMDRQKDIIISGGENISSVEVENIIYRHPEVQEVAVIPTLDPKWGEVVKAFVVPKDGCRPSSEDIINFCRDNLAHFKAPKTIEFGELPKTATGKIQKAKLRDKEWKETDRGITESLKK
ncbi:MAG: acyl--CoA ligase family protein [Desulfobacterales bacterium]|jgi:fatty-acyl-CoA synthase|nr:acyl-CoA synthetase [Desulfobacter sp.]MDP6394782.1 acyl--CoA ligase family protein [Desulfobacterales bacterium]MDP6683612.1 acyl--CoA ligase family protein [Desulfobacterales bacterium]MDP6806859.1 acyl--CoA ligase family protein [Desulfobacterales bacterium]